MAIKFPLSGDAVIDAVRADIEQADQWGRAESQAATEFYILRAAKKVDRFEPFTSREARLNTYLLRRQAGKRLCEHAWRILAKSAP